MNPPIEIEKQRTSTDHIKYKSSLKNMKLKTHGAANNNKPNVSESYDMIDKPNKEHKKKANDKKPISNSSQKKIARDTKIEIVKQEDLQNSSTLNNARPGDRHYLIKAVVVQTLSIGLILSTNLIAQFFFCSSKEMMKITKKICVIINSIIIFLMIVISYCISTKTNPNKISRSRNFILLFGIISLVIITVITLYYQLEIFVQITKYQIYNKKIAWLMDFGLNRLYGTNILDLNRENVDTEKYGNKLNGMLTEEWFNDYGDIEYEFFDKKPKK